MMAAAETRPTTALGLALLAKDLTPDKFKTGKRQWGRSIKGSTVEWENPDFGTVVVNMRNFSLNGDVFQPEGGPNTWARLSRQSNKPKQVDIAFTGEIKDNITLFHIAGTTVTNMMEERNFPPFNIPITWKFNKMGDEVPHTREKDKDNVDLLLLRNDGKFAQLQVSVVVRGQRFWLCVQEIYYGQIASTSTEKAAELGLTCLAIGDRQIVGAPLAAENAYPRADYLKTFKTMGPQIAEYATKNGTIAKLSDIEMATWQPEEFDQLEIPKQMKANGWMKAQVTFFNLVIGWGFALCEDGEPCMVHFHDVIDSDGKHVASATSDDPVMPVLQPMTVIALQRQKGKDGKGFKATAIQVPAPAPEA